MKEITIINIFLLAAFFCFSQNNLIKNESFEYRDFLVLNNKPNDHSQIGKSDKWKEDQNQCLFCQGVSHSPDWFYSNNDYIHIQFFVGNNPVPIFANTGLGYAGLGCGELIEQKLENDLKFGKKYKLTMSVLLSDNNIVMFRPNQASAPIPVSFPPQQWVLGSPKIDVILGKEKIKYASDDAVPCTSEWYEKDNSSEQFVIAGSIPLNAEIGINTWRTVVTEFVVLDEGFNWVAFELTTDILNGHYVLVDDIQLIEDSTPCEECVGCSPTDGCINVTSNNLHIWADADCNGLTSDVNNPLTIFGLDNISYLKWDIFPAGGQIPLRSFEINKPRGTISWDGKDQVGNEVPDGGYYHKFLVANDCGAFKQVSPFSKAISVCSPPFETGTTPQMNYSSIEKFDYNDDCCYECITINASTGYSTLSGDLSFVAIKCIYIGPDVFIESGTNLTLQAGEEVSIIGGVSSITILSAPNAESIIEIIDECEPPGFASPNIQKFIAPVLQSNKALNVSEPIDRNTLKYLSKDTFFKKGSVEVYPNPSSGKFNVSCVECFSEEAVCHLKLINTMGITIFENYYSGKDAELIEINSTNFTDGIYYLLLKGDGKSFQHKVVKE